MYNPRRFSTKSWSWAIVISCSPLTSCFTNCLEANEKGKTIINAALNGEDMEEFILIGKMKAKTICTGEKGNLLNH